MTTKMQHLIEILDLLHSGQYIELSGLNNFEVYKIKRWVYKVKQRPYGYGRRYTTKCHSPFSDNWYTLRVTRQV